MLLRLTECDETTESAPIICTLDEFMKANSDGIDSAEMAEIQNALNAGKSYRLSVAQSSYCIIERETFADVLQQLAANDGAILYWQCGARFKQALDAGAIKQVGELLIHPDAIEVESGMAYTMETNSAQ